MGRSYITPTARIVHVQMKHELWVWCGDPCERIWNNNITTNKTNNKQPTNNKQKNNKQTDDKQIPKKK